MNADSKAHTPPTPTQPAATQRVTEAPLVRFSLGRVPTHAVYRRLDPDFTSERAAMPTAAAATAAAGLTQSTLWESLFSARSAKDRRHSWRHLP
jgi:hypothetical protein